MPIIDDILAAIQDGGISDVLSGAAKGGMSQKQAGDYLKLALGNQGLARDKFAVAAPGERLATGSAAAMDAALANAGPTEIHWGGRGSGRRGEIPTTTGGFHDALGSLKNNPDYMSLLDVVGKDSLAGERAGGASGGNRDAAMPDYLKGVGDPSKLDSALGGAGLGASILAALMKGGSKAAAGGGSPSSGGGDVGKLLSKLFGGHPPMDVPNLDNSDWAPSYDPFNANDPGTFTGSPSDPSGGTGTGPGMQSYYEWLAQQPKDEGSGGNDGSTGTDWGDE